MKNTLFDISPRDVRFRHHDDKIFFEDQKDQRKFTIGSIDVTDNRKIEMSEERKQRDKRKSKKPDDIYIMEKDVPNDRHVFSKSLDSQWKPVFTKQYKNKLKGKKITLTLHKKDWLKNVCAIADKTISSDRSALQLAGAAVSSSGGAENLTLSASSVWRGRKRVRTEVADTVKQLVAQELSQKHKYVIHWDEKLLNGRRHVDSSHEYMAVVLTNLFTGRMDDKK